MMQDPQEDNPYRSPCADQTARKPGPGFRRTRVADLAIVGGVRGSVIGGAVGGGIATLLRSGTLLWPQLSGSGVFGEIAGMEAILAEIVGFVTFGAILGAITGLVIGATLGIIAGRTSTRFRRWLLILSVGTSAASGLGWSALFGLTPWSKSHAWHPILSVFAALLVIFAAALGGVWLAIRIADAAWGRDDLDSLPKSERRD